MKGTAINRSDLMQQLADKYHMEIRDAEVIVRVILERMSQALISGERIEIRGFGSFELRYRKPRKARNPKTGEEVMTAGKYSIHFKPGKEMRERVNESMNHPNGVMCEAPPQQMFRPDGTPMGGSSNESE